jgi:uncharacterized coiled-coil protein SlyX
MSQPELTRGNRVVQGQKFLSLVDLDARIAKLEAEAKESKTVQEQVQKDMDEQLMTIQKFHEQLKKHQEFGHPNNKPVAKKQEG